MTISMRPSFTAFNMGAYGVSIPLFNAMHQQLSSLKIWKI